MLRDFNRDRPAQARVYPTVDVAHASLPEFTFNTIRTQTQFSSLHYRGRPVLERLHFVLQGGST